MFLLSVIWRYFSVLVAVDVSVVVVVVAVVVAAVVVDDALNTWLFRCDLLPLSLPPFLQVVVGDCTLSVLKR